MATSKTDQVVALLKRPEGATQAQVRAATGWKPDTIRGFFSGVLKGRLGHHITSKKIDGQRVYRISEEIT